MTPPDFLPAFVPGAVASTGRVALVTGGAKRIGAAVVRALASRGYSVAIHCHASLSEARALAAELEAAGLPSLAVTANLRDEGPVRAMVHRVADHFGRIDAVVTCAAIWIPGPLEEVTADDLRAHFDVNCVGTFIVAQEAGAVMVGQETGGAIVTLGDQAIARPAPDYAAYFPSKGAIPALTRSLAVEFARRNPRIRVNCVLPGPVTLPPDMDLAARAAAIGGTLAGREGTPEHVAHAVLCLIENDFVTGVCLPVDGGRSIATPVPAAAGS
ncbi:MAG: SDR family oxidoreductase [Pirellulales bacterium]